MKSSTISLGYFTEKGYSQIDEVKDQNSASNHQYNKALIFLQQPPELIHNYDWNMVSERVRWITITDCGVSELPSLKKPFQSLIGLDLYKNKIQNFEYIYTWAGIDIAPKLMYIDLRENFLNYDEQACFETMISINPNLIVINKRVVKPAQIKTAVSRSENYSLTWDNCGIYQVKAAMRSAEIYKYSFSNKMTQLPNELNFLTIKTLDLSNCSLFTFNFSAFPNCEIFILSDNNIEKITFTIKNEERDTTFTHTKACFVDLRGNPINDKYIEFAKDNLPSDCMLLTNKKQVATEITKIYVGDNNKVIETWNPISPIPPKIKERPNPTPFWMEEEDLKIAEIELPLRPQEAVLEGFQYFVQEKNRKIIDAQAVFINLPPYLEQLEKVGILSAIPIHLSPFRTQTKIIKSILESKGEKFSSKFEYERKLKLGEFFSITNPKINIRALNLNCDFLAKSAFIGKLVLVNASLTTKDFEMIVSNFPCLTSLNLSNNKIETLRCIQNSKKPLMIYNLYRFTIFKNKIIEPYEYKYLKRLPNLRYLSMDNIDVKEAFKELTSVKIINSCPNQTIATPIDLYALRVLRPNDGFFWQNSLNDIEVVSRDDSMRALSLLRPSKVRFENPQNSDFEDVKKYHPLVERVNGIQVVEKQTESKTETALSVIPIIVGAISLILEKIQYVNTFLSGMDKSLFPNFVNGTIYLFFWIIAQVKVFLKSVYFELPLKSFLSFVLYTSVPLLMMWVMNKEMRMDVLSQLTNRFDRRRFTTRVLLGYLLALLIVFVPDFVMNGLSIRYAHAWWLGIITVLTLVIAVFVYNFVYTQKDTVTFLRWKNFKNRAALMAIVILQFPSLEFLMGIQCNEMGVSEEFPEIECGFSSISVYVIVSMLCLVCIHIYFFYTQTKNALKNFFKFEKCSILDTMKSWFGMNAENDNKFIRRAKVCFLTSKYLYDDRVFGSAYFYLLEYIYRLALTASKIFGEEVYAWTTLIATLIMLFANSATKPRTLKFDSNCERLWHAGSVPFAISSLVTYYSNTLAAKNAGSILIYIGALIWCVYVVMLVIKFFYENYRCCSTDSCQSWFKSHSYIESASDVGSDVLQSTLFV